MYIPNKFKISDWAVITQFAAGARAADVVSVESDGTPVSTLMPFIWDQSEMRDGYYGKLVMHMAAANPQWQSMRSNNKALAIIRGQQAYISPTNYEKKFTDHKVVPTWNYQSLHLTGTVEVSEDRELLHQIVSELTDFHEADRKAPWAVSEADHDYITLELEAIVAVIFHVEKVEAKFKLSQNRSSEDQERIIADLEASKIAGESTIASEMKRLKP